MLERLFRSLSSKTHSPNLTKEDESAVKEYDQEFSKVFNGPEQLVNRSYSATLDSRSDAKLVVFGLPKSGNVWLVSLLADCLSAAVIDPFVETDKKGVGMCHLPFSEQILRRADFVQAVYLVRDLRDVIVSYFYNAQTDWFRKTMPNFDYPDIESFYYEFFLPRIVPRHEIFTHAQAFAERGVPVIRYERMLDDTEGELQRLLRRLGLEVDDTRVASVVTENSFDRLKEEGKHLNDFVPPSHFRLGRSGTYRDELPEGIRRHVGEVFSDALRRWGYELDA